MRYLELSNEQRRQLIDAQQLFEAWRPSAIELGEMGGLYWNSSKGVRYLYTKRGSQRTSLGRETPELAARKADHDRRRKQLLARIRPLAARIENAAPVNRAMRIGRLPATPAKILRRLDMEGLLGDHIIVAGTNALYAYEAASGTLVGGEFVATSDADLLWDARRHLELTGSPIAEDGLLGMLRQIDDTFEAHYGFNATNKDGYIVDLIAPEAPGGRAKIGAGPDLEAVQMNGARWLLDSPRFEQVVVGADGVALRLVAPEPRTFALHKLWLSQRPDRQALKKSRDAAQADIVAELARKYLGLSFAPAGMPWLPADLRKLAAQFKA